MMKLSREALKKIILQEIGTTTKIVPRVSKRGEREAEEGFFGEPLEGLLDSAQEERRLNGQRKSGNRAADIAYKALFLEKDPIALRVYDRYKSQNRNIFNNLEEFANEIFLGIPGPPGGPAYMEKAKEMAAQARAVRDDPASAPQPSAAPPKSPAHQAALKRDWKELMASIKAQEGRPSKLATTADYDPIGRDLKEQPTPSQIKQAAGVSAEEEESQRVAAMNKASETGSGGAAASSDLISLSLIHI